MTESEAIELGNKLYANITSSANNIIKTDDYIEFVRIAINALEKQIPKKPKERDCIGFNTLVCPVCKEALYLYEPYCDNCGQAIDWSDEK